MRRDTPVALPAWTGCAVLLLALGSFPAPRAAASPAAPAAPAAAARRAAILPPGTSRVRVHFPAGVSPRSFLESHAPGARVLSERPGPFVDLALAPADVARLRAAGFRLEELPPEALDAAVNPTLYTFAQMASEMQALAATYPSIAALTTHAGATHDGNPILEMKLSDNVAQEEDEPTVFFVGVHHGGEMIGCDVLMKFLNDTLAGYGSDPQRTQWIDDHETRVIAIGNPDGWYLNETGQSLGWRKNKRDNNTNGQFDPGYDGVDLNRNFDYHWGMTGSSFPGSSTYWGPFAGSEPEVQVVENLLLANKPLAAISFHMSGEVVILPWGWNGKSTPDNAALLAFGQQVAAAIPKQSGFGKYFAYVDSTTGGYVDDWIYGRTGGFCMTVEVSWSPGQGPIGGVVSNVQGSFPVVFQRVDGPQVTGIVTDASSGAPLAAKIEVLEINTSELPDRMSDAAFGRYRWLLLPGTYTLRISQVGYHTQTISGVSVTGSGPTTVDVALIPHFASYGPGLAGSGGAVPALAGAGTPVLGSSVSLDVSNALGGAVAAYMMGLAPASIPAMGGTLLVAPPAATLAVTLGGSPGTPGAGTFSLGLPIPNNPGLSGVTLYTQVVVADPGAPSGVAFTAGLETHVQ